MCWIFPNIAQDVLKTSVVLGGQGFTSSSGPFSRLQSNSRANSQQWSSSSYRNQVQVKPGLQQTQLRLTHSHLNQTCNRLVPLVIIICFNSHRQLYYFDTDCNLCRTKSFKHAWMSTIQSHRPVKKAKKRFKSTRKPVQWEYFSTTVW